MHYTYVLISKRDGIRYIGYSSIEPTLRLIEHNSNKGKFTRGHQPWKLVFQEEYNNSSSARQREKFLKSGQGRKWLDEKLNK